MNWNNLKLGTCPKCGSILKRLNLFYCTGCDFRIALGKAYNIAEKIINWESVANNLIKKNK